MSWAGARGFAALVVGTAASLVPVSGTAGAEPAGGGTDAAGSYIVVLEDSPDDFSTASAAEATVVGHADDHDVTVSQVYSHSVAGYAAELTPDQVAELEADGQVAYVEKDRILELSQTQEQVVPTGVQRMFGPDNPELGIGGPDDERVDVDIAVIDSGVALHPDLSVVDRVNCTLTGCPPGGGDDHGHGTHVAGSAAAVNNDVGVVGVAPGARIWSQKVCYWTGYCSMSAIVAGVDHVTANADTIEVANMSLGGSGEDQALADAIDASVAAGVVYVVAAGNSGRDAADSQPANHPDVVTVSALADSDGVPGGLGDPPECRDDSEDDHLAPFSNWGAEVEVAAPGVCITSTWNDGGYQVASGTSMASPHAAGAAALLTAGDQAPADRDGVLAVRDQLVAAGNLEWTWESRGEGDYQEPLLDVGDPAVFSPDRYIPAAVSVDVTCDDAALTCDLTGSASHPDHPVSEWSWKFGDGQTASGQSVTHTYDEPGLYDITLTVTAGPATGTATQEQQVGEPVWGPLADTPGRLIRFAEAQCPGDPDSYYKFRGIGQNNPSSAAHRYDYSTDSWTELAAYPGSSIEGPTAVCTDQGTIHVMGGTSGKREHYVYDIATDSWSTAAPLPRDAVLAAAGFWDGKIYLAGGGSSNQQPTDQVDVYDPATDSWSAGPTLPTPVVAMGSAQLGSSLYLVGGFDPDGPVAATQRLDLDDLTWSTGPDLTAGGRYELALVATDTALYAVGGFPADAVDDGSGYVLATDRVERLDLSSWPTGTWTTVHPLNRQAGFLGGGCGPAGEGAGITSVAGGVAAGFIPVTTEEHRQMVRPGETCGHLVEPTWTAAADVPGGQAWFGETQCGTDPDSFYKVAGSTGPGTYTETTWRYEGSTDTWHELAPYPPGARAGMTAVCSGDDKVHVMGGLGGGAREHYVYDVATDSWAIAAPLPHDTAFAAAGAWDGRIYLLGGTEASIIGPKDTVAVYDIDSDTWLADADPLPEPMAMMGQAQTASKLYLVGGFGPSSPEANVTSTLRFDMATGAWSTGPSFASARYALGLAATDGALYAVGGMQENPSGSWDPTDRVEQLDLGSWPNGEWSDLDPLPAPSGFVGGTCVTTGGTSSVGTVGGLDSGLDIQDTHHQMSVNGACAS